MLFSVASVLRMFPDVHNVLLCVQALDVCVKVNVCLVALVCCLRIAQTRRDKKRYRPDCTAPLLNARVPSTARTTRGNARTVRIAPAPFMSGLRLSFSKVPAMTTARHLLSFFFCVQ